MAARGQQEALTGKKGGTRPEDLGGERIGGSHCRITENSVQGHLDVYEPVSGQ